MTAVRPGVSDERPCVVELGAPAVLPRILLDVPQRGLERRRVGLPHLYEHDFETTQFRRDPTDIASVYGQPACRFRWLLVIIVYRHS